MAAGLLEVVGSYGMNGNDQGVTKKVPSHAKVERRRRRRARLRQRLSADADADVIMESADIMTHEQVANIEADAEKKMNEVAAKGVPQLADCRVRTAGAASAPAGSRPVPAVAAPDTRPVPALRVPPWDPAREDFNDLMVRLRAPLQPAP